MPVIYIIADNIDSGDTGRAIALGLITGVDTTGYPGGTEIFVGVGGGWTSTRPTGSAIVQILGYVTKEGNGGQGVVLNPGPANLPNLPSGSVWVGNSGSVPVAVLTSSLSVLSSSFALTASYYQETDPIFVAKSASLATTGSNTFMGDQVVSGSFIIDVSSSTDALRVTQRGNGNAIIVEDSANPDATPFVVAADGRVGIGTSSPDSLLHIHNASAGSVTSIAGTVATIENSSTNYLSMLAPNANYSGIVFGSPADSFGAYMRWRQTDGFLDIATADNADYIRFIAGNDDFKAYFTTNGFGVSTLPQYALDINGSARVTSSLYLPGLTTSAQNNVVLIDTSSGQLYYTASSAFGGGSSTPTFPYTGSAIISGSLTVTGSIRATAGITGSLQGTSSWASNAVFANGATYANQVFISENTSPGTYSIPVYPDGGYDGNNQLSNANISYDFSTQALTVNNITASNGLFGTASWATNALTASYIPNYITTASVSSNTITFTKGDGSTFPITVNTGSGGGGGLTFQQVQMIAFLGS
jgi:hypothetical protein